MIENRENLIGESDRADYDFIDKSLMADDRNRTLFDLSPLAEVPA